MTEGPVVDLETRREAVRRVVAQVPDPEIPVVTIDDLGILRDVIAEGDTLQVVITPTYSGCPAMRVIEHDIVAAVEAAGLGPVQVTLSLSPAWTTDWMSDRARQQLRAFGIAPPGPARSTTESSADTTAVATFFRHAPVTCPRCGSLRTTELAAFGSTACKSLWRCEACREPFDHFKAH